MRKRPSSPGRGLPTASDRNGGYAASMTNGKQQQQQQQQRRSKIGRVLLLLNAVALLVFWGRSTSASSSNDQTRPLVLNSDGSVSMGERGVAAVDDASSSSSWSSSALGRRLGLGGGGGSGSGSVGSFGGNHYLRWGSSSSSSSSSSLFSSSSSTKSSEDQRLRDRALLDAAAARLGLALESPVVQAALSEAERLGRGGRHVIRRAAGAAAGGGGGTTAATADASTSSSSSSSPPPSSLLDLDAEVEARYAQLKAAPLELARGHDKGRERRGYYLSYVETDPLYPFQRIRLGNGSDSGVVAVIAPFYDLNYFRSETQRALFWRLKASGHVLLGVSSYQEFPGAISNPHDDRHVTKQDLALLSHVDGWLHCFRPERAARVIPAGVPRLLLSESDFTDPERRDGGGSLVPWGPPEVNKTWDLVYSDQGGDWNDYARNWPLAIDCIIRLAEERNASTLVMGRDPAEEPRLKPWVEKGLVGFQPPKTPWRDFLKKIESAKVLFAPNGHDASPRVVAEALSLDVAVLVNANIDGGWKYGEHEETGATFTSAGDVISSYDKIVKNYARGKLAPRRWFKENSGIKNSAIRLEAFLELTVGEERLARAAAVGAKVTQ